MNTTAKYIILNDWFAYDFEYNDRFARIVYDINGAVVRTIYSSSKGNISDYISLNEALESKMITTWEIIDACLDQLDWKKYINDNFAIRSIACERNINNPLGLKVKVTRGRKFKGEGYLAWVDKVRDCYGWGAYHECYNYKAVIIDLDGNFNYVADFSYLTFDDDSKDDMINNVYETIEDSPKTISDLVKIFVDMSKLASNNREAVGCALNRFARQGINAHTNKFVIDTCNKEIKHREDERAARKQKEMVNIREWVIKNTDKKTPEDIERLAEHIWNKRNR